jgi:hypothetical protein
MATTKTFIRSTVASKKSMAYCNDPSRQQDRKYEYNNAKKAASP